MVLIPFDAAGTFHPVAKDRELKRLAVRGAAATLSAATLSLPLRMVSTIVLARMLMPADFGVVAMVTTFSLLLQSFGTSGFSEAVIQREEMNHYLANLPLAIDMFRYMAGWATKITGSTLNFSTPGAFHSYTLREPIGVVAQIIPWNFPC